MTTRTEKAKKQYQNTIRKLDQSDDLRDQDREIIEAFDDVLARENLQADKITKGRWAVHIDGLRLMAERTGELANSLEPGEAGDRSLATILRQQTDKAKFAGTTISNRLQSLQLFGRRMASDDAVQRFEDLDPASHRPDDPTPLRTNILDWHDAVKMAKTRDHVRDQAMILTEWAAGGRPESEMWQLQFKHVEVHETHVVLSIPTEAKNERRDAYIFAGSAIFRLWKDREHPAHLECESGPGPDTYVWTHLNKNEHLGYDAYYDVFNDAGKAAGIEKDHNPEHFRRSRASVLASRTGISEQDLRNHFGWTWNSDTPANYIATFGGETGRHVAKADGADVDWEDPPVIAPLTCTACGQQTTRHFDDCIYCDTEIPEEAEVREAIVEDPAAEGEDLLDLIMDGTVTAEDIRSLKKLEPVLRTRPDTLDDLDQLEKLAGRYHDDESDGSVMSVTGPAGLGAVVSRTASAAATRWARAKHMAMTLHPDREAYPPSPRQTAGIGAAWTGLFVLAGLLLSHIGSVAAGPGALVVFILAIVVGVAMVVRDLPTLDESVAAAANR